MDQGRQKTLKISIMNLKAIALLLFIVSLFSNTAFAAECLGDQQSKNVLTFEVVPQFPPSQIFSTWGPLLDKVGKKSGLCFELIVPKDIPEFESDFSNGRPDFIYANPYHFLVALKKQKYNPLLAESKNLLSGLVVEKASNPETPLKSLNGKRVAFPAPNAFGASLLVRGEFAKKGIAIQPVFVKTHGNVYRSVIAGDTAAGGGLRSTLDSEPKEIQDQLKVIYTTQKFTPHPIATKPTISENLRKVFLQSFINCADDETCKKDLAAVGIEHPKKVTTADFKNIEELHLEKYAQ
jgi:phosphonate transport system substrate-binding protein